MTKLYQIVCAFFVMQTISILPAASSQAGIGLGKITSFSHCGRNTILMVPDTTSPFVCIKALPSPVGGKMLVKTRGSSRMFDAGLCLFMASSSNVENLAKVDKNFLEHLFDTIVRPAKEMQCKRDETYDESLARVVASRGLEEFLLSMGVDCSDSQEDCLDSEQTAPSDVTMDRLKCNKETVEQSIQLFQEKHAFKLLAELAKESPYLMEESGLCSKVFDSATNIFEEEDFVKCSLYWIPFGKMPKKFEFNFPYKERNEHSKPNDCVGITELAQPLHHISGIAPSKICSKMIGDLDSQIVKYGLSVASARFVNTIFKETDVLSKYEKAFFVIFDFAKAYGEIDEADSSSSSSSSY